MHLLGGGMSDVGTDPPSGRSACLMRALPVVCYHSWMMFVVRPVSAWSSFAAQCGSFYLVVDNSLYSFQIIYKHKPCICICKFGVTVGGGEFKIFLHCHLPTSIP